MATLGLLTVSRAERAGIWLAPAGQAGQWVGCVEDRNHDGAPPEWARLDPSLPFLRRSFESGLAVMQNLKRAGVGTCGPLLGMSRALWTPLRMGSRTFGIALTAWTQWRTFDNDDLQRIVDDLSLALAQRADAEHCHAQDLLLGFSAQIQHNIRAGLPSKRSLEQIAQKAMDSGACVFFELGICREGTVAFDLFKGPHGDAPPFSKSDSGQGIWKKALEERRTIGVPVDALSLSTLLRVDHLASGGNKPLRVVAIPLLSEGEPLGIAVSGIAPSQESLTGLERLDSFASLAAMVLLADSNRLTDSALHREANENSHNRTTAELKSLLDAMDLGIAIFDATGAIRHVNRQFGDLFGLHVADILKLRTSRALAARLKESFSDPEDSSARGRAVLSDNESGSREELALDRPVPRALERLVRPVLAPSGAHLGWLEAYRDLTAQKLSQVKLQQTSKLAALGRMASGLAHELNNPLTSIVGYAQLLLDHSQDPGQKSDLRKIYHEAERASHIAKNLLLFARTARPERRLVDLNEIVRSTLSLRDYELKLENIIVERDLDPGLPLVLADPGQIQQVVLNLILNAEQAAQQVRDTGHIRIRTTKFHEDRVLLEVADDGPGLLAGVAEHIFDPFFTTKPLGQGTGLGLSIAREIMEEYDGTVRLANSSPSGAVFQMELPAASAATLALHKPPVAIPVVAKRGDPALRLPHPAEEPRKGKRVLVVEDEYTVAQLIGDVLRDEGHHVDILLDSREGLEAALRRNYDLLVCDLKMPRLDGRAFYAALEKARNPLQHHVLFVTGDTLAPHTMEFLEAHRLPFVAKPFLVSELKYAVERAFQPAASNAQAASGSAAPGWTRESARKK